MLQPVEISEKAVTEIKHILEKKNIPQGYGLRVATRGGRGCAGVQFVLGFDKEKEKDTTYEVDGLKVHIQKGEMMYLMGKKVDFYEGADARGFVFVDEDQDESSTVAR